MSRSGYIRKKFDLPDYPPEVIEQANRNAAATAAKKTADAQVCGRCGKTRGHGDHTWAANQLTVTCRFQAAFNEDDE